MYFGQEGIVESSEEGTTASQPLVLKGHDRSGVYALLQLAGGRIASGGLDCNIKIWIVDEQSCVATLNGHSGSVNILKLLNDDQFLSGCEYGDFCVWDIHSYQCITTLNKRSMYEPRVVILPKGCVAFSSTSLSGARVSLNVWNTEERTCTSFGKDEHTDDIDDLIMLNDFRLASASKDRTIRLWDESGKCVAVLRGHKGGVLCLLAISEPLFASGDEYGQIKIWNSRKQACKRTLRGHTHAITALTALSDGRIASGSYDNCARLWDLQSGACVGLIRRGYAIRNIVCLQEGGLALVGSNCLGLWDIWMEQCNTEVANSSTDDDSCLTSHFAYNISNMTTVEILRDGRIATSGSASGVLIWDVSSNVLITVHSIRGLATFYRSMVDITHTLLRKCIINESFYCRFLL